MKKTLGLLLTALLAILLIPAIGSAESPQTIEIGDYQYQVPSGWSIEKGDAPEITYVYEKWSADSGTYLYSMYIEDTVLEGYEGIYLDRIELTMYNGDDYIIEETPEKVWIPAQSYRYGKGKFGGYHTLYCLWINDQKVYCMYYANNTQTWEEMEKGFADIISSINLRNASSPLGALKTTSRKNPAGIGDRIELQSDFNGFSATTAVTVEEVYRGSSFDKLANGAYVSAARDGYEHIAVRAKVEFVSIDSIDVQKNNTDDPEINISAIYSFDSYSSIGAKYDNTHFSLGKLDELTALYEGAYTIGYFYFEVKKDDETPLLVYAPNISSSPKVWISLK